MGWRVLKCAVEKFTTTQPATVNAGASLQTPVITGAMSTPTGISISIKAHFFFIVFLLSTNFRAQTLGLQNIAHEYLPDGNVSITYDLIDDTTAEYTVTAFLESEQKSIAPIKLMMLSGDRGTGKFAGKNKRILWYKSVEYENDFESQGLFLALQAEKLSGGISWYYYAGAGVLGGAAAVLFLTRSKESSPVKTELIDPPGRP